MTPFDWSKHADQTLLGVMRELVLGLQDPTLAEVEATAMFSVVLDINAELARRSHPAEVRWN